MDNPYDRILHGMRTDLFNRTIMPRASSARYELNAHSVAMNTLDTEELRFPLKVALTAMSEQVQASVEKCLSLSDNEFFCIARGDQIPDVIIIDHDHPGTAARLSKSNWQQNIPLVILSTAEVEIAGAIMVRKPLKSQTFANAATRALAQLTRQKQLDTKPELMFAPQVRNSELSPEDSLKRARAKADMMCGPARSYEQLSDPDSTLHRFDPAQTISSLLLSTIAAQPETKALQFRLPNDDIFVFPTLARVFTSTSLDVKSDVNRMFKDTASSEVAVITHNSTSANKVIKDININKRTGFALDAFIWLSTLFSTSGRLPLGFDVHSNLHLTQWPKLNALELTPKCLEITSCLAGGPANLASIIEQTQCEPRYATSYINAARAIGVLTLSDQPANNNQ